MRIGAMLGDVSRSLFKKPVTELYPFERRPAPERLRGQLTFDAAKCTGCKICVRDCPAFAIELHVVDKATKRFVMTFHTDRCTFCAQCVVSCNFDALGMSHERWELAALDRASFATQLGRPEDIEALKNPPAKPAPPAAGAVPATTPA
jgi:formate hydrogenlyase subunit 6/NADH:ubiquinone oxidoreductase subunit I